MIFQMKNEKFNVYVREIEGEYLCVFRGVTTGTFSGHFEATFEGAEAWFNEHALAAK